MGKRGVKVGIGLVAVGGIAAAVMTTTRADPTIGFPHPPPAHAEVATVVDAETVDVKSADQITRIRLGNIATPEPIAPGLPVACLQPEAAAQLRSLIPAGTQLDLAYDTDRFGRTVAQATTSDGQMVNAELVRAGLAEPVSDATTHTMPPAITAAAQDALTNKRGVHAPGIACTVPGQVKALTDKLAAIPAAPPAGADLNTLVTAANNATEARIAAERLASDFAEDHQDTTWSALDPNERAQLEGQVKAAVDQVNKDELLLRAATNVTVNQQATATANNREQARIAKALAQIRKAELERAAQAAHRLEAARKAEADAEQARREAEHSRSADPSDTEHTSDSHSSTSDHSDSHGDSSSRRKKSSSDN